MDSTTAQKRKRIDEAGATDDGEQAVFRSSPIEDRDSTFIGFFSPTLKPKDLQNLEDVKSASHKILGWRRESNQQSITKVKQYTTGHDDDGEKYGGSKVQKVLMNMSVIGSCVVARWYGGTMLGPMRFTHMEESARAAVRAWQDHVAGERTKKRKVEDEALEKENLVKVLAARDQSIAVLRALATEKEQKVKDMATAENDKMKAMNGAVEAPLIVDATANAPPPKKQTTPSAPAINYESMPVDRLRSLEKARDATLAFLLKRIDKAEAEVAAAEEQNSTPKTDPP